MMERLSPLVKNTSVRRLSLELCQKFVLSPNNSNLIASPPKRKLSVPSPSAVSESGRSGSGAYHAALNIIPISRLCFSNDPRGGSRRRSSVVNVNVIPPSPPRDATVNTSRLLLQVDENLNENSKKVKKEPRRKSSTSQYDFHEEFLSLVLNKCQLHLDTQEILGRGSFGTVVAGAYHGKSVAVKVIRKKDEKSVKGELNALSLPDHDNIAKVIDILQLESNRALIIMERLQKGNLLAMINDTEVPLPFGKVVKISRQIASALLFCHSNDILHLDVKPQNILIHPHGTFKLSDFGNSKRISELQNLKNFTQLDGTVAYKAPELFRGEIPTEKCDVFSLAITMWQLVTREQPYMTESEHSVIYKVVAQGLRPKSVCTFLPKPKSVQSAITKEFVQIYEESWNGNPKSRPFMYQVLRKLINLEIQLTNV